MRGRLPAAVAALLAVSAAPAPLAGQDIPRPGTLPAAYDSAAVAWHAGRYPDALAGLDALLGGADAARVLEPAALLTGELYHTSEIAPDGRAPRWSRDGRWAAFETSSGAMRTTHLVAMSGGGRSGGGRSGRAPTRLAGLGLVFSPDGRSAAYLSVPRSPALDSLVAAIEREEKLPVDEASIQRWNALRARLATLEAETARIVTRDLASGREREITAPGLRRYGVAFGSDARALYLVGGPAGDSATRDLWALDGAGRAAPPRRLTQGAQVRTALAAAGGALVATTTGADVLVVPAGGGEPRRLRGTMPALSADGRVLAFVAREGAEYRILTLALDRAGAEPVVAHRAAHQLDAPALSPDGRRVVFQAMPREDWELFVATVGDTAAPRQLTMEIQHDRRPRFVDSVRVLAAKGEGRHLRSYLYDVRGGEGHRLFHNNTVRTVAPEYEWAASPDGTKVLVVSERDGDTISPERGVYLVDLARRVTAADVRARVRTMLAGERALRARGDSLFAPMAEAVRAAVADVSVPRIHGYAQDLYRFGSKYVGKPGNLQAIDYLVATLRSFGYEPEVQWFEAEGHRSANVIARLPGTANPELVYVASSHFDSVEEGPGADDNTSGTTALLEAARVLARRPQAATIEFAWFTGEEAGLLGSREYVRRAQASGKKIVGALNNDMIGWANDDRLDDTIRYSSAGLRDLQHAAAFLFTDLITYDAKYYKNTDAHAYYEAYGDIVAGIGSYPILGNPHYHQPHDVLETVNQRLVAEVSRTTLASLMRMAAGPSRLTNVTRRGGAGRAEVTWTAAPERGVTGYAVVWGPAGAEPVGRMEVKETRAVIGNLPAGAEVRVRALGAGGLAGWDWAVAAPPVASASSAARKPS